MKKLFKNYNLELNKNEKKILTTFCKQMLRQTSMDEKYYRENRVFNSVLDKLSEGGENVKLTKDEFTRLKFNIQQNIDFIQKQYDSSWFLKKWLLKSILAQYKSLYNNHFDQ